VFPEGGCRLAPRVPLFDPYAIPRDGPKGGVVCTSLRKDFTNFITKGNIIQLAIAFVMGVAFASVVSGLTVGIITPLIGEVGGTGSLANQNTTIGHAKFLWGAFLADVINFLIVAVVLFFLIVYPLLRYEERKKAKAPPVAPTTKECPYCHETIPIAATRCGHCTSQLPVDSVPPAAKT
jgi:large conductance mechanosensitive channel